jgi:hypothetical protein
MNMKIYNIMHRYLVISITIVVAMIAMAVAWQTSTAFAANSTVIKPRGLTLSPVRTELDIAPGTTLGGKLTLTNSTDKPMTVSLSAEEFNVTDPQYDYAFTPDTEVTKWVSFSPPEIDLAAGQTIKVPYIVGVPLSAEPVGRYISLFATTKVGTLIDSTSDTGSQQRVGSLLYITVTGNVLGASTRMGHVISLSSPWFVSDKGIWSVNLQNAGATHFRSDYKVQTQNLFGGIAATSHSSALILPGTIRLISDTLPLPKWPGIYKIVYTIGLGNNQNTVEARYMLYMTPLEVIVFLVIIFILVTEITRRIRKH